MIPKVLELHNRSVLPIARLVALPAKRPGPMILRRRRRMAALELPRTRASFGDVVVTAFDEAARHSTNPREIAWLATQVINQMLLRAQSTARRER